MQKENEAAIDIAVHRALVEDRKKRGSKPVQQIEQKPCPKCPKCDCSGNFDMSMCENVCSAREETCTTDAESAVVQALLWLENLFPAALGPWILLFGCFLFVMLILRGLGSLASTLVAPRRNYRGYDNDVAMRNAVRYYPDYNGSAASPPPPATTPGASTGLRGASGVANDIFSPNHRAPTPQQQQPNQIHFEQQQQMQDLGDSIYESPSGIITPSKRVDLRRRSPFSPQERRY